MSAVTVYSCKQSKDHLALLRRAAALYCKKNTESWTRMEDACGKPFFSEAPELCFSVSHSGDFWSCAFGPSPLGLDLQIHENCPFSRISRRFFHADEDRILAAQNYDPTAFFRVWTAKESYLKRIGTGITDGLGAFSVFSPLPDGSHLQYLPFAEGYTMCLCTKDEAAVSLIRF